MGQKMGHVRQVVNYRISYNSSVMQKIIERDAMDKPRIIEKDSFDRVRKTIVLSRIGDTYKLNCKLYKRGNKDVTYRRGDNFLMYGRFRYTLSENAVADVEKAIEPFDGKVDTMLSGTAGYRVVKYDGTGITLYYKPNDNNLYDSLTLYEVDDENDEYFGETECILSENVSIIRIPSLSYYANRKYSDAGYNITMDNLHDHPLYLSAVKNKDILMQYSMEVLYGNPDESVLDYLEEIDGVRFLPRLSREFDKKYTLLRKEVDECLLMRSGYVFWHRPYFAMKGSLHERCELNPYTKHGVDAGKKDAELTSFDEYLALFNDHSNWNRNY